MTRFLYTIFFLEYMIYQLSQTFPDDARFLVYHPGLALIIFPDILEGCFVQHLFLPHMLNRMGATVLQKHLCRWFVIALGHVHLLGG